MSNFIAHPNYCFAGDSGDVVHVTYEYEKVTWVRYSLLNPARTYSMICGVRIKPTWMGKTRATGSLCPDCAVAPIVRNVDGNE